MSTTPQGNPPVLKPGFRIGDVVWHRESKNGKLWWPAMVTYDPNMGVYFRSCMNNNVQYHVQFFGLTAMRGWVSVRAMKVLTSPAEMALPDRGVSKKTRKEYEVAMKEVGEALKVDHKQRKLKFIFNFSPSTKPTNKQQKKPKAKTPPPPNSTESQPLSKPKPRTSSVSKDEPSVSKPRRSKRPCPAVREDVELDSDHAPIRTVRKQPRIMDGMKQNIPKTNLFSFPPPVSPPLPMFPVLPITSPTLLPHCNGVMSPLGHAPMMFPSPYKVDPHQQGTMLKVDATQQPYLLDNHLTTALVPVRFEPNPLTVSLCFQPTGYLPVDPNHHVIQQMQVATFPHHHANNSPPMHLVHSHTPAISHGRSDSSIIRPNPSPSGQTNLSPSGLTNPSSSGLPNPSPSGLTNPLPSGLANPSASSLHSPSKFNKQSTLATLLHSESNSNDTSSEVSAPSAILTPPNSCSDEPTDSEIEHSKSDTSIKSSYKPESTTKVRKVEGSSLASGVCCICDQDGVDLLPCSGHCYNMFHLDCLGLIQAPRFKFVCDECLVDSGKCLVCSKSDEKGQLLKCSKPKCSKLYHLTCIHDNKLFTFAERKKTPVFTCPLHTCGRCKSIGVPDITTTNLIQCTKCPLALHRQNCLIAGCEVINSTHMICYQHLKITRDHKLYSHINLNTCLDCGKIGSLYCCDICSAAYHSECLEEDSIPNPDADVWKCPSCAVHDLPIYGSIVLCKFGMWRWWPAEVVEPSATPDNIEARKAGDCMFAVRFCGTKDYSWMHHGRVIPYTGPIGTGNTSKGKSQNAVYKKALLEAEELYKAKKEEREAIEAKQRKPDSKRFTRIKTNKYLVPRRVVNESSLSFLPCQCSRDQPCNDDSSCVNRASHIECEPDCCPVGNLCQNQRLLKCQEAKTTPFHTGKRGWGLHVDHDISAGDFVVEYIGEVLDTAMCRERLIKYHENRIINFYMLTLDSGLVIDASLKSNHARFMNHSCDPNCESQKWTVKGETRIGIFACVDIAAGTELTFDYHLDSLGNEKKQCLCGSKNCSGFMGLKSAKVTASAGDGALKKKPLKRKRQKRKKIVRNETLEEDTHEDDCFVCGDGGELLLCDSSKCSKAYHLECLQRKVFPPKSQSWKCPRHFCQVCQKDSHVFCTSCPISYCRKHSDGKFVSQTSKILCLSNCSESPVAVESEPIIDTTAEQ